jgi:hypothetical protein
MLIRLALVCADIVQVQFILCITVGSLTQRMNMNLDCVNTY